MFKNKRVLVALICIISATIIAVTAILTQNFSFGNKTQVVVAATNISAGQKITESNIKTVEMVSQNLPKNVISNPELVVGKYTTVDFRIGDFALITKITAQPLNGNSLIAAMDSSKIALAIPIEGANGFNNKLMAGDVVKIFESKDDQVIEHPNLQYVKILSITKGNSTTVAGDANASSEETVDEYNTVVVEVSPEQAKTLVELTKSSIYLAYICHGSNERAPELLAQQEAANNQSNTISSEINR